MLNATPDSKADSLQSGSEDQQLHTEVPKTNGVASTSPKNDGIVSGTNITGTSPLPTDPPQSDIDTCLQIENDISMKKMGTENEVNTSSEAISESSYTSETIPTSINKEAPAILQSNGSGSSKPEGNTSLETKATISTKMSTIPTTKTEIPVAVTSQVSTDKESNDINMAATNGRTDDVNHEMESNTAECQLANKDGSPKSSSHGTAL